MEQAKKIGTLPVDPSTPSTLIATVNYFDLAAIDMIMAIGAFSLAQLARTSPY